MWMPWSAQQLRLGQVSSSLVINLVVYAELLGNPKFDFDFDFDLDAFLDRQAIDVPDISRPQPAWLQSRFASIASAVVTKPAYCPTF